MKTLDLSRDAFGRLIFRDADGTLHDGVVPVRAFPILAPDDGLALVSSEGRELIWLNHLSEADAASQQLIAEELSAREFIPELLHIVSVSSFACPSVWEIDTNRGRSSLVLNGEEDIRRIGSHMLLIADKHGIQYLLRDLKALDRHSRKLLDRFL